MFEGTTLADAIEQTCEMINSHRAVLQSSHFPHNGHTWDCDEVSRMNIIGVNTLVVVNGGVLPDDFVWRDSENNNVPMSGPQMVELGVTMFAFLTECYKASWIHKAAVSQLTTVEEVAAYSWDTTLWPSTEI